MLPARWWVARHCKRTTSMAAVNFCFQNKGELICCLFFYILKFVDISNNSAIPSEFNIWVLLYMPSTELQTALLAASIMFHCSLDCISEETTYKLKKVKRYPHIYNWVYPWGTCTYKNMLHFCSQCKKWKSEMPIQILFSFLSDCFHDMCTCFLLTYKNICPQNGWQ